MRFAVRSSGGPGKRRADAETWWRTDFITAAVVCVWLSGVPATTKMTTSPLSAVRRLDRVSAHRPIFDSRERPRLAVISTAIRKPSGRTRTRSAARWLTAVGGLAPQPVYASASTVESFSPSTVPIRQNSATRRPSSVASRLCRSNCRVNSKPAPEVTDTHSG